jgi:hypothetical protein
MLASSVCVIQPLRDCGVRPVGAEFFAFVRALVFVFAFTFALAGAFRAAFFFAMVIPFM